MKTHNVFVNKYFFSFQKPYIKLSIYLNKYTKYIAQFFLFSHIT